MCRPEPRAPAFKVISVNLHRRPAPPAFGGLSVLLIAAMHLGAASRTACGQDSPAAPVSAAAKLAAAAIHVPEGYRVAAVASEPNLANPVAFCFDPAGRIFVAETFRVRQGV